MGIGVGRRPGGSCGTQSVEGSRGPPLPQRTIPRRMGRLLGRADDKGKGQVVPGRVHGVPGFPGTVREGVRVRDPAVLTVSPPSAPCPPACPRGRPPRPCPPSLRRTSGPSTDPRRAGHRRWMVDWGSGQRPFPIWGFMPILTSESFRHAPSNTPFPGVSAGTVPGSTGTCSGSPFRPVSPRRNAVPAVSSTGCPR